MLVLLLGPEELGFSKKRRFREALEGDVGGEEEEWFGRKEGEFGEGLGEFGGEEETNNIRVSGSFRE